MSSTTHGTLTDWAGRPILIGGMAVHIGECKTIGQIVDLRIRQVRPWREPFEYMAKVRLRIVSSSPERYRNTITNWIHARNVTML